MEGVSQRPSLYNGRLPTPTDPLHLERLRLDNRVELGTVTPRRQPYRNHDESWSAGTLHVVEKSHREGLGGEVEFVSEETLKERVV